MSYSYSQQTHAENVATVRLRAILTSPEANGRAALAEHLAFNTDLPVATALEILKASSREAAPAASPQSAPAMSEAQITAAWNRAVERVNARVRARIAAGG